MESGGRLALSESALDGIGQSPGSNLLPSRQADFKPPQSTLSSDHGYLASLTPASPLRYVVVPLQLTGCEAGMTSNRSIRLQRRLG
jgi:hypothetical protein